MEEVEIIEEEHEEEVEDIDEELAKKATSKPAPLSQ